MSQPGRSARPVTNIALFTFYSTTRRYASKWTYVPWASCWTPDIDLYTTLTLKKLKQIGMPLFLSRDYRDVRNHRPPRPPSPPTQIIRRTARAISPAWQFLCPFAPLRQTAAFITAPWWRAASDSRHKGLALSTNFSYFLPTCGARGSLVVRALCYKPEGLGFETRWGEWIVSICLIHPAVLGPVVHAAPNRGQYQKQKNIVSGGRSQWPRSLRHELSSPAPTLRSWVRMPLRHGCLYVFCVRFI
jgi:hypothetical protein